VVSGGAGSAGAGRSTSASGLCALAASTVTGSLSSVLTCWKGCGRGVQDTFVKVNAATRAPNNKAKLLALFTVTLSPVAVHRHAVTVG
jgi:hypothetical protein